ncbi:MAG: pyruvate dehydrogenase (acetyl-transferring) E1 component subunit alpha [Mariprofundales bacterium]
MSNTPQALVHAGNKYTAEKLRQLHNSMLFIRRFEEKAGQLYGLNKIGGFCHLCNGQEGVIVGSIEALDAKDYILTGYRDHGHSLARGSDPLAVMAELLGKSNGIVKGKGGSMHMFDSEHYFAGGNGIVAEQVPIGLGLAFANKYRSQGKEDANITACFMGDGAINQGAVYESFNMAALWQLPIVFVVENNQYAMGTAINRASAETHLFKRGISFKIPGVQVDGMDVLEVHRCLAEAAEHARSGKGPMLVEAITYRYRGHSMSDPATYRTRAEVNEWRTGRDPIARLQSLMIGASMGDDDSFRQVDRDIKKQVAAIAKAAEAMNQPHRDELFTDVYKSPIASSYPYADGRMQAQSQNEKGVNNV